MSFRSSDNLSQSFDLLGLGDESTPPPQDHSSFTAASPYTSQSSADHDMTAVSPSRWETFSRVNENLLLSAKEHRNALDHKKTLDKKTQSGHASLWTFPTQERSIEGYCGCNVPAVYTYTFRVATFNQSLYERLKEDFAELHEHNVGEVFMTLFEQTVSELQLSRLIHSQIPRLSAMSKVDAFRETRDRLDALFELLASAREFSTQAQDLLQALVIFLGSFMVSPPSEKKEQPSATPDRAPPASPLLDLLGNESAPSSPSLDVSSPHSFRGARSLEDEISCYFVEKLASVGGLTWGQGLLQFSVEQVEKFHLLQLAVSEITQCADSPASDFISLFSQFPWQQLGSFSNLKLLQKELLAPIRQCIDYAAEKHYFDVLLMLGNILLACSYEYEEATFECISAITAGKWPMKMVCSRLLQRAPLFKLKKEYLVALFGHLYNLHNQPPLEFASLTETERHPHRRAFVEYLVRFPVPVEIMDNKEDPAQYQPVLPLIYQLASHASSGSQFQRMIVRELFYFAFVESVVECAGSDLELHLLQRFRSEAAYCLRLLVERNSSLMGTVIFCIGQNLHLITVKSLIEFMKPSVFARWSSVDLYTANWIAHFFAQWKFPPGNDTELKGNAQLFQYLLDSALQPPRDSPECSPSMVTRGVEVGQVILRSINWSLVEPAIRIYFALIIIKARHHLPAWWSLDQLSSSLGRKLLAPPLDEMCIQAILNVNPETFPDALAEAYLLQLLVALNIVSEQNRNNRSTGSNDESGHQWLLNFNFYRRAADLLSRTNAAIAADLFTQMDILRDSPAAYPHLQALVQQICNADRPSREEIPKILASALYQSLLINSRDPSNTREDNEKRVRLWMNSAFPEGRQEKGKYAMINSLIAFAYCNGYSLDTIVSTFRSKNYTRNDIINMSNDGFPWCALAALYVFQPVLPSGNRDRNCALVLLQDIAQNEGTSAAAVALWLHYFMIYFTSNPHGANEIVPKATQDNLSRHFITTAKSFETSNQEIYRLYYAFSTWKKAIVDSATGDFHEEQNIDLMDAVTKELPEYLQGKQSIRVNDYSKIESLIPFRPLATAETEDLVLSSLPGHQSVPEQKLASNMDQYSALEQGIESAVQFLRDLNNHVSSPTEQIEIPLVSHLLVLLENYSRTSQALARLDEQFLELTKQSYYNFQKAFQVRAPCQKEGSCIEPARLEGQTVSIEPAYPNAIIDIQANRTEYGREYGNLFDVSRALAQISVLLRNSLEMICQSETPLSPECAVAIFFTVVKKIILTNLIPSGTPIASQVIESLLFIGRRYIQNRPEFQMNLFKVLLATPSNVVAPRRQRSVSTMSSASRSAIQFVGSSETNEATNAIQQKIPADLYSLFTPQSFVQQGDVRQYLDLLETVVQQTGKSEEELRELSKCFESTSFLPLLESQLTEDLVERLISIVPVLLGKPSFASLGSTYVSFLVRKGYQHRTLSLLFSPSVPGAYASQMVEKLQMDTAQLDTVISILQSLHSRLPLAEQHIDVATTLLERTTAQSPAFQEAFRQENPAGYDSEGKPITSRLWNIVYEFYSERGIINERSHVTDRQLARFLNVLYAIVEPSGANIIDKLWYLFSHSLLPALGKRLRNREFPLTEEILWTMANSLPWRQTRFLLYDPDSLAVLNKHLHNVSNFICGIFKQLDWDTFTSRLARSNQSKLISTLGLSLLQLVLRINLIEPSSIPSELYDRLVPSEESDSSPNSVRIDWRLVDGPLFAATFNGEVLISPIREGLIHHDPSLQLLSNCEILKTVALRVEKPQAILGCIREASSLMLYAIKTGQGLYWYLPLASQLQLLSSMIIPLTHQTTGDETSSCEMTLHVLSCILCQNWTRVENIDLPFHNATIYPNGFTQDPAFTDFATRVKGLVIQFCGACSPSLALRIIKTVPMIDPEGAPQQAMTPDLWLEITENTLRTYFASAEDSNALRKVSSVAKIPHHDRVVLLQHAQNSKPLSLLLLLDHWRAEVEQQNQSTQWPSELFEYSTHFLPGEHRSFNAIPLWFFILQLVQSPRFDPVQCQQDAMKFLSYFKSLFEKSGSLDAPIFLAAKAVELFFFRIIRRRTMGGGDKGNKALMEMFERFRKLRNQSSYKDYQQFFEATEHIMDPLYTTESLQQDILGYLFPTAQPMLQPLLSSSF